MTQNASDSIQGVGERLMEKDFSNNNVLKINLIGIFSGGAAPIRPAIARAEIRLMPAPDWRFEHDLESSEPMRWKRA
jgi:hypothetical protein